MPTITARAMMIVSNIPQQGTKNYQTKTQAFTPLPIFTAIVPPISQPRENGFSCKEIFDYWK